MTGRPDSVRRASTLYRSARNIEGVEVAPVADFNTYDILKQRYLLLTREALAVDLRAGSNFVAAGLRSGASGCWGRTRLGLAHAADHCRRDARSDCCTDHRDIYNYALLDALGQTISTGILNADNESHMASISFDMLGVPEPAGWMMMVSGFGLIGVAGFDGGNDPSMLLVGSVPAVRHAERRAVKQRE